MLLDANVLLCAVDNDSTRYLPCARWVDAAFNGQRRIALPWQTIGAFLRISTHPRIFRQPLTAREAWEMVDQWLAAPICWVPEATERTAAILGGLVTDLDVTGNLITDAQLAALAIEHGLAVVSVDSDFARFPNVRWINPS